DRLFKLKLPGRPGHSDDFGPWQSVDFVVEGAGEPRKATPADQYEIRYRSRDPNVEYTRPTIAFELNLPAATPLPDDFKSVAVKAVEAQNDMGGTSRPGAARRKAEAARAGGVARLAGDTYALIAIRSPTQPPGLSKKNLPPLTRITETIRYATTSPGDDQRTFGPWQDVASVRELG